MTSELFIMAALFGGVLIALIVAIAAASRFSKLEELVLKTLENQNKINKTQHDINKNDAEVHRNLIATDEKIIKKVLTIGGEVERLKMANKDKK